MLKDMSCMTCYLKNDKLCRFSISTLHLARSLTDCGMAHLGLSSHRLHRFSELQQLRSAERQQNGGDEAEHQLQAQRGKHALEPRRACFAASLRCCCCCCLTVGFDGFPFWPSVVGQFSRPQGNLLRRLRPFCCLGTGAGISQEASPWQWAKYAATWAGCKGGLCTRATEHVRPLPKRNKTQGRSEMIRQKSSRAFCSRSGC